MKTHRHIVRLALVALVLVGCKHNDGDEEETGPPEVAVETAEVVRATLHAHVDGYGTIEPEPADEGRPAASARVSSAVAGVVAEARAVEGQAVDKGAVLFLLDDRLAKAAADEARQIAEKARQAEKLAELTLKRVRTLFAQQNTSRKLLQEAEQQFASAKAGSAAALGGLAAAETRLELHHITAPLAGTITRVDARPGESVAPSVPLAEIVDLGRLVICAKLPSAEAGLLEEGQALEVTGGKAVRSTLAFICPQVDARTDTLLVRAPLPAGAGLRPGQFVHLRIITAEHADCLAVPRQCVYTDHDGRSTLSVVEGGVARQRVVKVGLRDGPLVEVEGEGLREGTTVVALGSYALPDGAKVHILNSGGKEAGK